MEHIDYTSPDFWAKAPEGATHFGPENDERFHAWYKQLNGKWMCFLVYGSGKWVEAHDCELKAPMIARPELPPTWNGIGLPPVGVECECCYTSPSEYYRVKIIAHDDEKAVFRWIDGPMQFKLGDGDHYTLGAFTNPHPTFRPILTPEQIAAEERKAAVDEMRAMFKFSDAQKEMLRAVCYSLYDAGYRKTAN